MCRGILNSIEPRPSDALTIEHRHDSIHQSSRDLLILAERHDSTRMCHILLRRDGRIRKQVKHSS